MAEWLGACIGIQATKALSSDVYELGRRFSTAIAIDMVSTGATAAAKIARPACCSCFVLKFLGSCLGLSGEAGCYAG